MNREMCNIFQSLDVVTIECPYWNGREVPTRLRGTTGQQFPPKRW